MLVVLAQILASLVPITPNGAGAQQGLIVVVLAGAASTGAALSFGVGMQAAVVVADVLAGLAALALTGVGEGHRASARPGRPGGGPGGDGRPLTFAVRTSDDRVLRGMGREPMEDRMRILVVEDDARMAALIQGVSAEGMAADTAGAGEDAVWMAALTAYDARRAVSMCPKLALALERRGRPER